LQGFFILKQNQFSIVFNLMILFKKGVASNFIVTLNESKTIAAPTYVFTFTHLTLKSTVVLTYLSTADLSAYPSRFNEFAVTSTAFTSATDGQYSYVVKELVSNTILEVGKMLLQPSLNTERNGYGTQVERSGFNG